MINEYIFYWLSADWSKVKSNDMLILLHRYDDKVVHYVRIKIRCRNKSNCYLKSPVIDELMLPLTTPRRIVPMYLPMSHTTCISNVMVKFSSATTLSPRGVGLLTKTNITARNWTTKNIARSLMYGWILENPVDVIILKWRAMEPLSKY